VTTAPAPRWLELSALVAAGDGAALAEALGRAELGTRLGRPAWTPAEPGSTLDVARAGPILGLRNRGWRRRHYQPGDSAPAGAVRYREIHPQAGRWWGPRIDVPARQVVFVETVPADVAPRPLLIGVPGSVAADGRIERAHGRAGELARVQTVAADGSERAFVLAFAEDGLLSSIAGCRFELGMHLDTTFTADGLTVQRPWRPGSAAYRLARLAAAVDVPPTATVRCSVDGVPLPVRRAYAAARIEPVPIVAPGEPLLTHVIDLEPARRMHPDPDQPWLLRVEITGVRPAEYGGVHLVELPDRVTTQFRELAVCESPQLLDRAIDASGDGEIGAGTTCRSLVDEHRMRPDPPGATYQPNVDVGTPAPAALYRRTPGERAPAVVFVHGGGWMGGDRGYHYRHMWHLAARGYVTLNVEYRYHPAVHWRDSLADVKCAVRWLRTHAAQIGVDPDRIAIVGQSAGAHLAALTAATPGRLEGDGPWPDVSSSVRAAVLFYPPVDLPVVFGEWGNALAEVLIDYFDHELELASPARHIAATHPPTLTLTGDADALISVPPVSAYHAALTAAGVRNELAIYPGARHGFDIFDGYWAQTTERFTAFLDRELAARHDG
jgi:acetyl esterase/lipase